MTDLREVLGRMAIAVCVGAAAWAGAQSASTSTNLSPADERPPFRIPCVIPCDGQAAVVVEDAQGRQVRCLAAQVERRAGRGEEAWDLTDGAGRRLLPESTVSRGLWGRLKFVK